MAASVAAKWDDGRAGAPQQQWRRLAEVWRDARSRAAFVAQASSITVWSGVCINNAGVRDIAAAKFKHRCELSIRVRFSDRSHAPESWVEGAIVDLQDDGDSFPDRWLPAGGGVGEVETWACGTFWKRSGVNAVRVWSRRGTVNAGLMQRVAAVPASSYTFSVYGATSGQDATAMSVESIRPVAATSRIRESFGVSHQRQRMPADRRIRSSALTAAAQSSAITVFMRTTSTSGTGTSNYQWSDFDDATLTGSAGAGRCSWPAARRGATTTPT
jgi:hypothetical protein